MGMILIMGRNVERWSVVKRLACWWEVRRVEAGLEGKSDMARLKRRKEGKNLGMKRSGVVN